MSSPTVIHVTKEELVARREAVLESLGITAEELTHRAMYYTLTPDEWDAREELREIAFLLGE